MRAVLVDAVHCLLGEIGVIGSHGSRAEEATRARGWITNRGRVWPFSFERICEALDLDGEALRQRLLEDPRGHALAAKAPPIMQPMGNLGARTSWDDLRRAPLPRRGRDGAHRRPKYEGAADGARVPAPGTSLQWQVNSKRNRWEKEILE